ncbi:MAG: VOC family protein [Cyanobacteria bacterium P01_A01_bin.15]
MISPRTVSTITLTVSDAVQATAFYTQALGAMVVDDRTLAAFGYGQLGVTAPSPVRMVTLRLGNEYIELIQHLGVQSAPMPPDSRSHDLWFQHMAIVVSDMELAHSHLSSFDIEPISEAPQTIPADNPAAGGVRAFKFRDMDRHSLELIWFPADKIAPKWEHPGERLFLGIDHSAIAVSNTAKSIRFYQDILGMEVVERSQNSGTTQARLDGLPVAEVNITSLRPQNGGMGIELLDYIQPEGGRSRPQSWQIDDLSHRHLILEVNDIHASLEILDYQNGVIVSPHVVKFPDHYRYGEGVLLKDPDDHVLLLIPSP